MAELTLQQAFQLAVEHHQAGRLPKAEAIYRQILAIDPRHFDATHNLGVIAFAVGNNDAALKLVRQALAINPASANAFNNLGKILQSAGKLDDAIAAFQRATAINPNLIKAYVYLATALKDRGQRDQAIVVYRRAIALNPNVPTIYNNLGNVLTFVGKLDEAMTVFHQAIRLRPDYALAHSNLGIVLKEKRQFEAAVAAQRKAISLRFVLPEAHNNLGIALKELGRSDEALAAFSQAISQKPNFPEAHNNLGNLMNEMCRFDEAIASYQQALAHRPDYAEAISNLGNAYRDQLQHGNAIAKYHGAIAIDPDLAGAHNNLAMSLLALGEFQEGWVEHEWRWKCKDFTSTQRNFAQPQWDGSALEGRTLLLHAEQGFGDTLQFIRYLPSALRRGGRVIFECPPELLRILSPMAAGCEIIASGRPLPAFDFHCPLMSLPRTFATTLDTIPNAVPYLNADETDIEKWRQRLADLPKALNVGLVWAGSPGHKNNRYRSIKLEALAALGPTPGARFFSLQTGAASAQAKSPPAGMDLIDWTSELKDFADTAALIANLDLVIAVDTAIVHLTGALGKPVWTLLPFVPDWRWLLDREDSPWYPSMRLFRQRSRGDWDGVVKRVAEALPLFARGQGL